MYRWFLEKANLRNDSFPYPSLTKHILDNLEYISNKKGGFIRNWTCWESSSGGWKVRFEIGGNRFCLNKRREHKSNHIFVIVDLKWSCFYQKCHDIDCIHFTSQMFPLPKEEMEGISEFFTAEKFLSSL